MFIHIEIDNSEELHFLKHLFKEFFNMSKYVDDALALIATIAQGNAADPAVKAAVTKLQTQIVADEADAADVKTVVNALVKQLAAAPPTVGTGTGTTAVITALSGNSGSINGGANVTLTGTGFTGATAVNFGTVAGTGLSVQSDTSLTVTSPAQAAGVVPVTVVTPAGTSAGVAAGAFTYA